MLVERCAVLDLGAVAQHRLHADFVVAEDDVDRQVTMFLVCDLDSRMAAVLQRQAEAMIVFVRMLDEFVEQLLDSPSLVHGFEFHLLDELIGWSESISPE